MFKALRRRLHKDLMFIGVAVIIAGFIASGIIDKFNETAVETYAIITSIEDEESGTAKKDRINIIYNVDGEQFENTLGYYDEVLCEGEVVHVKYDPANPNKIRAVDGPDTAKTIFITGGVIFGTGLLLNLFMNWSQKHRAEKKAERKMEKKYAKKYGE